jgi:uncharacterized protein involved in exopolysaccharide biosynthesis
LRVGRGKRERSGLANAFEMKFDSGTQTRNVSLTSTPGQPIPLTHGRDFGSLDYLPALRSRWKLLAIGTLSCGLLGLVSGWLSKPLYEGRVGILVTQASMVDRSSFRAQTGVTNVRAMLENFSLAAQVIKEFGLDRSPYNLNPEMFVRGFLRLEEVRGTDVIRVKVRLPEPELAALVANRLAALGVELNRGVNRAEVQSVQLFLKDEIEKARAHMKDAQERVLAYKESAQIELARKDVESRLGQRGQLLGLQVEIGAETARLAKAEEELAKQQRILTIKRSIEADPVLTQVAREVSDPGTSLVGLGLREEIVNQVYETLAQQVSASRTKLSALQRQRAELTETLKVGAPEVPGLSQLYKKESELAKLDLEFELAKKVYSDLVARFEDANHTGRSTELQVVDPALTPTRPASAGTFFRLVAGLFLGMTLSMLLALLLEQVARAKRRQNPSTDQWPGTSS